MKLLTETELAEIEALCEAATPEPWVIGIQIAARSWPVFSLRDMETATEDEARRDAALIERCRTDLPRAVATIRVLKEECRQWHMRWDSVLALLHDGWDAQDIRETLGI